MASGTPVVATADPALREVAGDAAVYARATRDLGEALRRARIERTRLVAAGLARAQAFSWAAAARRTADVYREVLAR